MATILKHAGKEILEACRIHTRETALARSTGAGISPMTWGGAQYVFTITTPDPVRFDSGEDLSDDDVDDEENPEASLNQQALQEINVSDVLRETAELLLDDDLTSPLVQQLGAWLEDPMTAIDPKHLPPREYAAVGRHVLGLAAAVLERQLQAAAGALGATILTRGRYGGYRRDSVDAWQIRLG